MTAAFRSWLLRCEALRAADPLFCRAVRVVTALPCVLLWADVLRTAFAERPFEETVDLVLLEAVVVRCAPCLEERAPDLLSVRLLEAVARLLLVLVLAVRA